MEKKYGRAREARDENITQRIRFACWTNEATNTNSEYVILIDFPWQQWLRKRSSMLLRRYCARLEIYPIKKTCFKRKQRNYSKFLYKFDLIFLLFTVLFRNSARIKTRSKRYRQILGSCDRAS